MLADRCRRAHRTCYPVFAAWLESQGDLTSSGHDGALFSWLRLSDGVNSRRLADLLAGEFETNVVPGAFFEADDYIRIGFELPLDELAEGLARVTQAVGQMKARV